MTRPVRIHIHELVLHGVDPRERYAVGDALQHELREALAAHGIPPDGRVIDRINGGTLRVQPQTRLRGLGTHVAGTLKGALRR